MSTWRRLSDTMTLQVQNPYFFLIRYLIFPLQLPGHCRPLLDHNDSWLYSEVLEVRKKDIGDFELNIPCYYMILT
jgi:hypothetical protein